MIVRLEHLERAWRGLIEECGDILRSVNLCYFWVRVALYKGLSQL